MFGQMKGKARGPYLLPPNKSEWFWYLTGMLLAIGSIPVGILGISSEFPRDVVSFVIFVVILLIGVKTILVTEKNHYKRTQDYLKTKNSKPPTE